VFNKRRTNQSDFIYGLLIDAVNSCKWNGDNDWDTGMGLIVWGSRSGKHKPDFPSSRRPSRPGLGPRPVCYSLGTRVLPRG